MRWGLHVDDVDHEGEPQLVGSTAGEAEGGGGVVPHHLISEPDLDADDEVRVLAGAGNRLLHGGPAEILELPEQIGDHPLHGYV